MIDLKDFPELMTSADLVKLKLFSNPSAVYMARRKGLSPDYIKFAFKVLYPKKSVLEWLASKFKDGSIPLGDSKDEQSHK